MEINEDVHNNSAKNATSNRRLMMISLIKCGNEIGVSLMAAYI